MVQEEKEWRLHERVRRKLEKTINTGAREQTGVVIFQAVALCGGILVLPITGMNAMNSAIYRAQRGGLGRMFWALRGTF